MSQSLVVPKRCLNCTGWYTQLQLLVQTKALLVQDVTLTWPETQNMIFNHSFDNHF